MVGWLRRKLGRESAVILARGSGNKAQYNGRRATYTAMGQSGWTEVTLAGGVTLKWRNGHWAGAPGAPASQAAACLLAVLADLGARLSFLAARLLLLGAWLLLLGAWLLVLGAWLLLQGVRLLLLGVGLLRVAARLLLVGARLLLRGLWACARGLHMAMLVLGRALRWLVGRLLLLVVALGTIKGWASSLNVKLREHLLLSV